MSELKELLSQHHVECRERESLSRHSSFRIGGPARLACFPTTKEALLFTLETLHTRKERFLVIGNGSNVVFSDRGFDGTVVFTGAWKELTVDGNTVTASAGASLLSLSQAARDAALTGLEFAYGIPGTVGGAVFMNAGAFGGCMADVCTSSEYFDTLTGELGRFDGDAQVFSNRSSIYEKNPNYTVLSATLVLTPGEKSEISARMEEILARRRTTQPLEYPSAGSVFRRPVGYYAGKLIEDCRLKGTRVGGAEVSQKHAGFIVNRGGATAEDVRGLTELIRERVLRETGVELTCEIRFLDF